MVSQIRAIVVHPEALREFSRQTMLRKEFQGADAGSAAWESDISLNEEVFLCQLHCRSVLLNGEFQNAVRKILYEHQVPSGQVDKARIHSSERRPYLKGPKARGAMQPLFNSRSGSRFDSLLGPNQSTQRGRANLARKWVSKSKSSAFRWRGRAERDFSSSVSCAADVGGLGLARSPSLPGSDMKILETSMGASDFSRTCSANAAYAGASLGPSSFSRTCSADESLPSREFSPKDFVNNMHRALPRNQDYVHPQPYAAEATLGFPSGRATDAEGSQEPYVSRLGQERSFGVSILPAPVKTLSRMREKVG